MPFLLILLVIILVIAFMSIKIVKQSEVYIIERLGKFYKVADAGLTIILPFFDHVRSVVSLKQQTMDIPPQGVITKDNVTITIDTVVFYQITDPAKAVYEIQSLKKGIEYLAITTIRDIIGKMDLDETFSSRDGINTKLRVVLDEATAYADPENEEKMEAAIAELVKGKTLVVIAHKLPAIMNADQICVIDHGKLVAAGKHQDLIRSCPEYQKLWKAAQDSAEWKVHTAKEGA